MSGDSTPSSLRDLALSAKLRYEVVDIAGFKVEVREPSLAVRDEFSRRMKFTGELDENGNPVALGSVGKAQVFLAIMSAYDPETGQKIFKESDESKLFTGQSSDSIVTKIADVALKFINDAAEKAKN